MDDLSDYFRARIRQFGDDPRAAGWTDATTQAARFGVFDALVAGSASLLDVGCGPAHLLEHLRSRGWHGEYLGIDVLAEMVEVAEAAGRPARVGEIWDLPLSPRFDVVVASGVLSSQLGPDEERYAWFARFLRESCARARTAFAFNFLSERYDGFTTPDRWCPSPGRILDEVLQVATHVTVRHDYLGNDDCTFVVHLSPGGPRDER